MPPIALFRRLIEAWSAPKLPGRVRPGATPAEIESFEARYGVRLPPDFREYLLAVSGMDSNDTDSQMTSFWGLDSIQPASVYCRAGKGLSTEAEAAPYFIICDILIDSF